MNSVASGLSDRGMIREGNEDSFVIDSDRGLFAVADGMGGHNAGEVASRMAIDVLRDYISRTVSGGEVLLGGHDHNYSDSANRLASGIRLANRVIHETAQSNTAQRNMGTTIVSAILDDDRLSIAHVGDSRAYLLRNNGLIPLTEDHSLVAEQVRMGLITRENAESSTQRNIITRALGLEQEVAVDLCDLPVASGDLILLCSDGLTTMLADEAITAILLDGQEPEEICRHLVEAANSNGGRDNVTVVVLMVRGGALSGLSRMFNWARSS